MNWKKTYLTELKTCVFQGENVIRRTVSFFFCFFCFLTRLGNIPEQKPCECVFVVVSFLNTGASGEETRQRVGVTQTVPWLSFHEKLLILFSVVGCGCSILATTKCWKCSQTSPQLSLHRADDGLVFCSHVVHRKLTHARLSPRLSFFLFPPPCSSASFLKKFLCRFHSS